MTVCNNRYLVSMLFKRNMTTIIAFIWISTNIYFLLFLNTVYIFFYSIVKPSNVSRKTGHKHWCLRLSVPVFWALKKLDQYRMETSHLPASSLIDKACDEHSMKHNSSINQMKVSKAFPQINLTLLSVLNYASCRIMGCRLWSFPSDANVHPHAPLLKPPIC